MASSQPSQEVLLSNVGRPAETTFQVVNKKPNQAGGMTIFTSVKKKYEVLVGPWYFL